MQMMWIANYNLKVTNLTNKVILSMVWFLALVVGRWSGFKGRDHRDGDMPDSLHRVLLQSFLILIRR